jgi:cytochrome P450
VRIDRPPNRHISFSQGIHRCVGATLARAEFAVMLEKVLTRLPDYVVDEARAQRNGPRNPVNGWTTMPVTFTPGAPVADLPDAS